MKKQNLKVFIDCPLKKELLVRKSLGLDSEYNTLFTAVSDPTEADLVFFSSFKKYKKSDPYKNYIYLKGDGKKLSKKIFGNTEIVLLKSIKSNYSLLRIVVQRYAEQKNLKKRK